MTAKERTYVEAYRNVIHAVCDCTKFVSTSLRNQVDALEASMTEERIEELQDIARR